MLAQTESREPCQDYALAHTHTYRGIEHKHAWSIQVVGELFEGYVRTGALHKPWGVVDLDGDAIPTVFEVRAACVCVYVCNVYAQSMCAYFPSSLHISFYRICAHEIVCVAAALSIL
jgi:hypothetical protein